MLLSRWGLAIVVSSITFDVKPVTLSPNGEYFVSPAGKETNDGSADAPWPSVGFALEKVGGGNTITLLPGAYSDPVTIEYSGLPGRPTVVRSQIKWEAIIRGSSSHGIYTADGVSNVVIDGIQVANSTLDGIKVGSYVTVRNCWIHHSGGQGVTAHRTAGTVVEYNVIESNGTDPNLDHGIYISGTNDVIRSNVIRWNKKYGCQIYYDPPLSSAECQFYNNLVYGNGDALTVWSPTGQTNYVFNNTLISTNYLLIAHFGTLGLTNNILLGSKWGRVIWAEDGARIKEDYNLTPISSRSHGLHDVVAADAGFVNPTLGLFWLTETSPARGAAALMVVPPLDFFAQPQVNVRDLGAFQFDPRRASDQRPLDPFLLKPDYWPAAGE
jgi:hypothetical protein